MSTTTQRVEVPERASRQEALAPHALLQQAECLVIGAGAVGRQVALQLAAIGVRSITIYDHDIIEEVNLGPQLYNVDDLDDYKALVTRVHCHRLNPNVIVAEKTKRFAKSDWKKTENMYVFCCADSMTVRKNVWQASCQGKAKWLGDARVAGELIRVLTAASPAAGSPYAQTLYTDEEAHQGACSSKMIIYGAQAAASLLVARFAQELRGAMVPFSDVMLNLLSWEMFEQTT